MSTLGEGRLAESAARLGPDREEGSAQPLFPDWNQPLLMMFLPGTSAP